MTASLAGACKVAILDYNARVRWQTMRAIKLQADIDGTHNLRLSLPTDLPIGPAEVIVLVPEEPARRGHTVSEFLASLVLDPSKARSREEIDRELAAERASWN